jgi:autotransporter-associated beta strand protein
MKKIASLFLVAALVAGPAAAQTWTGAGPDNNWGTGANWSGGVAPASSPTTAVTFPTSTPRPSPIVDAPWTVGSLSLGVAFSGGNYTLGGQAITVTAGIAVFGLDTVSNPIVLAGPVQVTSCLTGTLIVDGAISGPGSLNLTFGNPTVILRGTNTYTGGTTVESTTLDLRGSMLGPVSLSQGFGLSPCNHSQIRAVLTGSGTVSGPVRLNGSDLHPNLVLNTGDLLFQGGSLSVTINGSARGTQYSTVNVAGAVGAGLATLQLLGSYTPMPGDVFTIIANDGSDAVAGTFGGLPEGATITFNGVPLRISYRGGTGNDVTLTASAAAVAPDVVQVPTLSVWALILLVSMVLGIGILRSRRQDRKEG